MGTKRSWKLAALLVLGTMFTLGYVARTRAFTLIEVPFLINPYVFNSTVTGQVKVTNISTDKNLTVSLVMFDDLGNAFQRSSPMVVLPGHTFTFNVNREPAGAAQSLRPVVTVTGADSLSSALAELLVFNSSGQIIAVLPAVQFPSGPPGT